MMMIGIGDQAGIGIGADGIDEEVTYILKFVQTFSSQQDLSL